MIKRLILYIVAVLHLGACWSQEKYPVAINAQLLSPYSLYLDDYTSEYKERIGIVLLNRDTYYPSMEVKLRFTIKSNGLVLTSNPYGRYQPILLDAGVPYSLKGAELTQYFLPQNLQASGLGSGSFNQGAGGSNRKLPEGMVEFNIEVLEFYSEKVISLPTKALAWISTHRPPLLTQPLNNQEISFRDPLNVIFQWTPLHSGLANVKYELIIKQLWDNGLRPEAAWAYSPEVFREAIIPTSLMYGAAMPPLLSGQRYAWAVRSYVEDDGGEVQVFENKGLSEIFTFSLEEHCPPPYNITATPDRGKLKLSWIPLPEHNGFTVSYRVQGSSEWFETTCEESQITLYDVRAGFSYEYRVGSACNFGKIIYSPSAFIKLAEASPNENCGLKGLVDTDNKTPLPALASGDIFLASDYPVYVTEASGSNGIFSGKGYTIMPSMFAKAKMAVTFDGIGINTDRKLMSGSVKAVYNESQSQIANIDEILEGGNNVGKIQKGITKAAVDLSFTIPDNATLSLKGDEITIQDAQGQTVGSFTIPEEIKNNGASIFPISVKDKDGNIYTIDAPVDPETGLADTSNLQINKVGKEGNPLSEGSVNFNKFDSKLAWVSFIPSGKYALDRWSRDYQMNDLLNTNYQARDTSIAYKLIPAGRSDRVDFHLRLEDPKIDPTKIIYKTGKGTEFTAKAGDNGVYSLQLPAAEAEDGYELYALYPNGNKYYNFGKLVVVSYPEKTIKLNIVPVNGTQVSKDNLSRELNAIYNPVGISLNVEVLPNFDYQGDKGFMEKGSGLLSAYTPAMRELQTAYGTVANDAAYLFYIKGGNGANRMDRDAAAFMPRNKQFAYVFSENYPDLTLAAPVIAHELGHGVLNLQHTFDYKIPVRTTENLMDYKGGTRIAKWQWDRMYDPGIVLGLFEKDKDAMAMKNNIGKFDLTSFTNYSFLSPSGQAIKIEGIQAGIFNEDGALMNFTLANGKIYGAAYLSDQENFIAYIDLEDKKDIEGVYTVEAESFIQKNKFTAYSFASVGDTVIAYSRYKINDNYVNTCYLLQQWKNQVKFSKLGGIPKLPLIPSHAKVLGKAGNCGDITGLEEGTIGLTFYYGLREYTLDEDLLKELCNYLNSKLSKKRFAFYDTDKHLEFLGVGTTISNDHLKYFIENRLFSKDAFDSHFPIQTEARGCDIIFSRVDLWDGIDRDSYNAASTDWTSYSVPTITDENGLMEALYRLDYVVGEIVKVPDHGLSETSIRNLYHYIDTCNRFPNIALEQKFHLNETIKRIYVGLGLYEKYYYDFSDLRVRERLKRESPDGDFSKVILRYEGLEQAAPISVHNDYKQYVAYHGTDIAFFLGQEYESMAGIIHAVYGIKAMVPSSKVISGIRGTVSKITTKLKQSVTNLKPTIENEYVRTLGEGDIVNLKKWLNGVNDGRTYIAVHGEGNSFKVIHNGTEVTISHRTLAQWIRQQNLPPDADIVLLSCSDAGAAQYLVNKLNRRIIAWEGSTEVHSSGRVEGQGKCYEYNPSQTNNYNRRELRSDEVPVGKKDAKPTTLKVVLGENPNKSKTSKEILTKILQRLSSSKSSSGDIFEAETAQTINNSGVYIDKFAHRVNTNTGETYYEIDIELSRHIVECKKNLNNVGADRVIKQISSLVNRSKTTKEIIIYSGTEVNYSNGSIKTIIKGLNDNKISYKIVDNIDELIKIIQ